MNFMPAANFTPANRTRVDLIVLHSAEAPEKPGTARAVARWFQREDVKASAHYSVDADETIMCVPEGSIAWGAPGANANGLQIEMAGYAGQNASQWADAYSCATITRTVDLCVELCRRWSIPAVLIGPSLLLERGRGITTHAFVSRAFHRSTHTDPGPYFPLEHLILRVSAKLREVA